MCRVLLIGLFMFGAVDAYCEELQTQKNIPYGEHPRQVLDFYPAVSEAPTPVVFYIHGGGWRGGDKKTNPQAYLKNGISVVAINYRYVQNAKEDATNPPVKAPLNDAARALQFVRSKAEQWNLDKTRIGATGGSAGACSSLWLAFHDEMADPQSEDPVSRESTRLQCAAVMGAQVSLDPKELREWMPNFVTVLMPSGCGIFRRYSKNVHRSFPGFWSIHQLSMSQRMILPLHCSMAEKFRWWGHHPRIRRILESWG